MNLEEYLQWHVVVKIANIAVHRNTE